MKIIITCLFVIFAMNAIGLIEEAEGGVNSCNSLNSVGCSITCLAQHHQGGSCKGGQCRCQN
ncbi:unnamed protein product [Psylliodes chrysocephalus]|uniref:Defensin n=1 Tax=Psylliodes chrysocephalus TaxID=3402493 RepID=A0A9P0CY41_9CUCU|nr:unnamed protein product [Psylliodes chrysocephala]